ARRTGRGPARSLRTRRGVGPGAPGGSNIGPSTGRKFTRQPPGAGLRLRAGAWRRNRARISASTPASVIGDQRTVISYRIAAQAGLLNMLSLVNDDRLLITNLSSTAPTASGPWRRQTPRAAGC